MMKCHKRYSDLGARNSKKIGGSIFNNKGKQMETKVYKIREIEKLLDIRDTTMRKYTEAKFIVPEYPANKKGSANLYSELNIIQIMIVQDLAKSGMTLGHASYIINSAGMVKWIRAWLEVGELGMKSHAIKYTHQIQKEKIAIMVHLNPYIENLRKLQKGF